MSAPLFVDATANLGSPQPCADPTNPDAEGCYTHYVRMVDLDGDGDLDLVFAAGGGYYVPADPAPLLVYENDGAGQFGFISASAVGSFVGRVRQIAIGDVDGDGDLDLFAPQGYGLQPDGVTDTIFLNDGVSPPTFTAIAFGTTSRAGATRFGDVDGDGDLDLVVTDWGQKPPTSASSIHLYTNDGVGHFSEVADAVAMEPSASTGPIDIDFADVDGDFDLDLVIAIRKGNSLLFTNDGGGTFHLAPFPAQPGPYVYGPDECDVDGDGDLDIWLDNGGEGHTEQLLINDGHGVFTDDTFARVRGNPTDVDDNRVQCADVDGDGDLDAVIASLSDVERVLENDGDGDFQLREGSFPAIQDSTLGLDVGDVDGDHILDVVTAQGESGPFLNRLYLGVAPAIADVRPPIIRALEVKGGAALGPTPIRFAVSDAVTTDGGPRLASAYLEANGSQIKANFVGGDLFRAVVPIDGGALSYRACAVDLAGNVGCSLPVTIAAAAGGSSAGGSAGSGGNLTAGGSAGSAGSVIAGGSPAQGGSAPITGGNGGFSVAGQTLAPAPVDSDAGCSHRSNDTHFSVGVVVVLAVAWAARRSRLGVCLRA